MSAPPVPSPLPSSSSSSSPLDSDAAAAGSSGGSDSDSGGGGGGRGGGKKSSYYFFKSTPAHEAARYMPTLLSAAGGGNAASPSPSPSPPPPSQSPEPAAAGAAGSRWNAAGTWEEKDLSSWAHARMTALLAFKGAASPSVELSCTKVSGDATLVYTRGKKRVGYDLAIQCEWRGRAADGEEVKGGLELPSVDQTSEDEYEMVVTVKERGKADDEAVEQLTRAAKKLRDTITSKIKQFEKELQEQ